MLNYLHFISDIGRYDPSCVLPQNYSDFVCISTYTNIIKKGAAMPDTLVDMFFANAERLGEKTLFQEKIDGVYNEISYNTAAEKATNFAYGLHEMGIDANDNVAIYSENRPEWAYSDLAILSLGAVCVPIYATLTISQAEYILNNSQSKVIIVSQPEKLEDVKKVFNNLKTVKRIITMFDNGEGDSKLVQSFDEVIRAGIEARRKNPKLLSGIKEGFSKDDVVSILYTSGTTGDPKGVMLTNHNFISNVESVLAVYDIFEEDLFLSFLPLSHVFERMVGYYLPLYRGASIAYAESPLTVGDNMREVHPTVMASVPRLYEKMYNLVQDNVSKGSAVKKLIFKFCLRAGKKHFQQTKKGKVSSFTAFKFRLADKLVFGKLRGRTGGRIRFFVSGGAPLVKEIGEFFAYAGIKIIEAYGLTETSPGITANPFHDCRFGTVGVPLPGIEVKIAEDGEICTRGPHVMKGYFNDQEATDEVIDEEK
jgi:long-chain acyl-CoA synthetase